MFLPPGNFDILTPLVLPNDVSIVGVTAKHTRIRMLGVTSATNLLTMGENCFVSRCGFDLTSSQHVDLKGVV